MLRGEHDEQEIAASLPSHLIAPRFSFFEIIASLEIVGNDGILGALPLLLNLVSRSARE